MFTIKLCLDGGNDDYITLCVIFGDLIKNSFELRAQSRRKQKKGRSEMGYCLIYFSLFLCQLRDFYHSKGENVKDVKVLNLR